MAKQGSILIVDDESGARESLQMILEPIYEVHMAAGGQEALECIKKEKIDLVTLDLEMPGLQGIDVLRAIKKINPDVEVVIITAHGTQPNVQEAIRYRAGAFISKPFDVADVIAIVSKSFERRNYNLKIKYLTQQIGCLGNKDFCQETHEPRLDDILNQSQSLSQRERDRIDGHITKLQAEQKIDEKESSKNQTEEREAWVHGTIPLKEESGVDRRKDKRVETTVRVGFEEEEYWGITRNLSGGGAFILTTNPMDLGDEFPLKLHIPDGREPIEVACRVVWTNKYVKESDVLLKGMGVKFLNLQYESRRRVIEHIESLLAQR